MGSEPAAECRQIGLIVMQPAESKLLPPLKFWILLSLAYVLLMIFVKPVAVGGDSAMYADDIERSLPHAWGETHDLWNFAHALWRPMGRLLSEMFLGTLTPHLGGNPNMAIGVLLMLPNLIAGLICGLVLQTMIWKLTGNGWATFFTAFAFLCLNPLLHYTRLGSPYIVGITCTTIATYLAAFHPVRKWWTAVIAGVLCGIAVLCWAPFLMSFPGVLFSIWILGRKNSGMPSIRFVILMCAAAGVLAASFYLFAMSVAGIHGVSGLIAWIHESAPDSKDAKALRMISGMARSFYELGNDSIWLKWYRFHDPYAKVGLLDLVRESLSKIAFFYTSLFGLMILLWHSATGKRLLLFIAVATLPHIGVALAYESGSVERYVGFLPALFLGFGYAIGSAELSAVRKVVAGLLCCLHIPFNVMSASERNISNIVQKDPARLNVLLSLPPASRIFVINGFDPIARLSYGDPLNPMHKKRFGTVNVVPAFGKPVELWSLDFACTTVLKTDRGDEVWVSKRFLSPQPQRSWLWVEGDLPGLTWNMLHEYFSRFDTGIQRGGEDGFFRITATGETRQRLLAEIEASGQTCEAK